MWVKRPRGQLLKCAKAASLRAAFSEEADYTAEEMAGKVIEADGLPISGGAPAKGDEPASDPAAVEGAADAPKVDMTEAIEEEVREQVARLVARADKAGAWSQAADYCRARFQGSHLVFALAELEWARAATYQQPVEQAA